jgi:hypothetical protein
LAKEAPDFSTGLNYISEDGIPSREPERAYTFLKAQPDGTVKLYTDAAESLRQLGKLENSKYVSRGFKKTIKEIEGLIMRGEEVPLDEKFNRNPTITLEKNGKNYYATANDAEIRKYTWIVANKLMESFRERQDDFKKFREERDRIELEEGSFFTNAAHGFIKEGYRQEKTALKQREGVLKAMIKDAAHIGVNTAGLVAEYNHVKEGREGLEKEEKVWEGANSNFESAKDYDSKLLRLYSALSRNQALAIGGILTAVIAVPVASYFFKPPTPDGQTTTTGKNRPPKADFWYRTPWRTLNFLYANDRDTIMFLNNSSDTLKHWWFLNGTLASTDRNFNITLPTINNSTTRYVVTLTASNGVSNSTVNKIVGVDPSTHPKYDRTALKFQKGVEYTVGWRSQRGSIDPFRTVEEMKEDIDVIYREIGAKILKLIGDQDDLLIKGVEIAMKYNFDTIAVLPSYADSNMNQTIAKFAKFSKDLTNSIPNTDRILLIAGNSLTAYSTEWVNIPNYLERQKEVARLGTKFLQQNPEKLNKWVSNLIDVIPPEFKGKKTYAAGNWEEIWWDKLKVDFVGDNAWWYPALGQSEEYFLRFLQSLDRYNMPVVVTQVGFATIKDVLYKNTAGTGFMPAVLNPGSVEYSQRSQAEALAKHVELYNRAVDRGVNIIGFCVLEYRNRDPNIKQVGSIVEDMKRKESFYFLTNCIPIK